jgi:hypothetical protein
LHLQEVMVWHLNFIVKTRRVALCKTDVWLWNSKYDDLWIIFVLRCVFDLKKMRKGMMNRE